MKKLVFVYNGDSGLVNGVMHYLHKRVSPSTYPCNLCGVIYDGATINKNWLAFIKTLKVGMEFLHRDEYQKKYGRSSMEWPAVLLHDDNTMVSTVLSAKDFDTITSLEMLQQKISSYVQNHL